ncbi:MAG: 4Fe-4S binding protein [Myxococcota bacterium]
MSADLSLSYERCVRTRSLASSCRACVDACPVSAVTLEGPKQSVGVDLDACTGCGLCQAACPTEAIAVFDVRPLLGQATLACGSDGLPCVGALSVEDLLTAAQRTGALRLVGRACSGSHAQVAARVEAARSFLAALGLGATLEWTEEAPAAPPAPAPASAPPPPVPPRRQFLGIFVPRALPPEPRRLGFPATLDVKRLREATPPARRARLLAALPSSVAPKLATLAAADVPFTSSKEVDAATCTGCSACVTACPTGALTSSRLKDQLRFDGSRCVKCGLCHDVCEPRAITLAPQHRVVDFLDFAPRALVTLKMVQCGECGASFKDDGAAEVLCPRCREQADEARALQGAR